MNDQSYDIEPIRQLDELLRTGECNDLRERILKCNQSNDLQTAADLCAADLEWRWRKQSGSGKDDGSLDSSKQDFLLPYLSLLQESGFEINGLARQTLISGLWFCESAWGVAPSIIEYEKRYQLENAFADELIGELDEIERWSVRAFDGIRSLPPTPIGCANFEVGRQKNDEPSPIFFNADQQRLVLFPKSSAKISRRQFQFRRLGRNLVCLKNVGKAACKFGAELRLAPGEQSTQRLPCGFSIGDAQIEIDTES